MARLDASHPTESPARPTGGPPPLDRRASCEHLYEVLERIQQTIAPVWPLRDYVAVNPYAGVSERRFLGARRFLRIFSDCETLMPLAYYAEQFRCGVFDTADIAMAIDESRQEVFGENCMISAQEIARRLNSEPIASAAMPPALPKENTDRRIRTLSEYLDRQLRSDWTEIIRDEIAKHCAAHYDEGQAVWPSPWKHLPLYQAWRSAALHDRNLELHGLAGFRDFVSRLPHTPEASIASIMRHLGVPPQLWETLLLCYAFSIPGWSAWVKQRATAAEHEGTASTDLAGLLAMRLAYDAALAGHFQFGVDWESLAGAGHSSFNSWSAECLADDASDDVSLRHLLLHASEIGYRRRLLNSLAEGKEAADFPRQSSLISPVSPRGEAPRKLAQMVFCIDVRSERLRRHLESACSEIETYGFAGFFGLPIEYVPLGETSGTSQLPVLLQPEFRLQEGLRAVEPSAAADSLRRRSAIRRLRKAWKAFQTSIISCFTFVETTGLLYGLDLLRRSSGLACQPSGDRFDGIAKQDRDRLGPTLSGLDRQGLTASRRADLAESLLRGLGLTDGFARLVVFCGHTSQTVNNPLQAGLDCGACGGHSGESNARFAAMLLNRPEIRQALAGRGIDIPEEVHFLAALHNTTTDSIELLDLSQVPLAHRDDVQTLASHTQDATCRTRFERMPRQSSKDVGDVLRRSEDWSEVRPEWGLAGNAAFIAAPRSLTHSAHLDGRAFLHSYDYARDPEGNLLEQIMTAPMIVAHWINMQYYASTVDNHHFGSGSKTIHNVVGRFGIYSGNAGNLMTGLPWQSLHSGASYQHHPLRLLSVIAAPRAMIEQVIDRHPLIQNLLAGSWLHLIAVEEDACFRYTQGQAWQQLEWGLTPLGAER